jgi:hypothetical protein
LFSSPRASKDIVEIALATFDGDLPVRPNAHIFVESGANWITVGGSEDQFTEGRSSARIR